MTRVPESGWYELVKESDCDGCFDLPEDAVVLDYTSGLDGSKIAYLKPVDQDVKSKTTDDGDN